MHIRKKKMTQKTKNYWREKNERRKKSYDIQAKQPCC